MSDNSQSGNAWLVVSALWMILLISISITSVRPPAAAPETAPASEFSATRAMKHVRAIAVKPHPVGSPEHDRVREYLLKELAAEGFEPSVQETVASSSYRTAGLVQNILARRKGASSHTAVLLTAHYDSVPAGPGAGDDGSGVATLLETSRALANDPPFQNDVIFLFTDGEELGLVGAAAFVDEHLWAKDVALVLNFDARGTSGPSQMFETSPENGWLVREFARAAPAPVASSLAYAVYQRMPNSTDMSVFKKAGLAGLNFAFIGSPENYHTPQDTPDRLDPRTLQHHGGYALALARHFANTKLTAIRENDAIFFNVPFAGLVVYPEAWAGSIWIALALLLVVVGAFGFHRHHLSLLGLGFALLAFLLSLGAAWCVGTPMVRGLALLHGTLLPDGPYSRDRAYFYCLVLLVAALTAAAWEIFQRHAGWQNMAFVGLIMWTALAGVVAFRLPAASYLVAWPALICLLPLGYLFASREPDAGGLSGAAVILLALCVAPGLLLLPPLVPGFFVALGLAGPGSVAVVLVILLLLWLLVPLVSAPFGEGRKTLRRWLLVVAALAGVISFGVGASTVRYDHDHPRPVSVFYVLNADTGTANWFASGHKPDEWTSQFVSDHPARRGSEDIYPTIGTLEILKHEAPPVGLTPPELTILDDVTREDVRTLRVRVFSPRGARQVLLEVFGTPVLSSAVNGKPFNPPARIETRLRIKNQDYSKNVVGLSLPFVGLPQAGVEIRLEVPASKPFTLRIWDASDGLPMIPGHVFRARPENITMQHFGDLTMVVRSHDFEGAAANDRSGGSQMQSPEAKPSRKASSGEPPR